MFLSSFGQLQYEFSYSIGMPVQGSNHQFSCHKHEVKEGYVSFIGYDTEIKLAAESGLETHIAFAEA